MARTDYTFGGWNTNSSGTGTNYAAKSSYTVTGYVTLYAIWTTKKRTVTYNGNGTTVGVPQSITVDSGTVITLPDMARTDYTFGGWYANSSGTGTNYAAKSSYTVTNNVTLYAKWTLVHTLSDSLSYGGQVYRTVKIGNQTWMAENLNYDTADGTLSWCYEDRPDNCAKYGRLYTWEAAKTVCPSGWHLPTQSELIVLFKAVGGSGMYGDGIAGKKLKSKNGWNDFLGYGNCEPWGGGCDERWENGNGTDDYGFSALPGGGRTEGTFRDLGDIGIWWPNMALEADGDGVYKIISETDDLDNMGDIIDFATSVHCIANR